MRKYINPKIILLVLLSLILLTKIGKIGTAPSNLREASYYKKLGGGVVRCELCPNFCTIPDGGRGLCTVRENRNGKLYSLIYAKPCSVHIDPIEKKPFFHVSPGAKALSIATVGCNLRCLFCQNWQISQSTPEEAMYYDMSPMDIVETALKNNTRIISYTYTEPTVFYEYMLDIAKLARQKGLFNTMHSCGYINPEPLKELCQYLDAANIDLKGFDEDFYKKMGVGKLEPVLEAIKTLKDEGVWLEITNLVIPTANDDPAKIREMCEWIKVNVGDDVPIHFSRFSPAYKLRNLPPTPLETLLKARRIAFDVGLKYVYVGNVPGNKAENTYCPNCGKILIKRVGYTLLGNNIVEGKCKFCGEKIAGKWEMLRNHKFQITNSDSQ